jgi:lysyl-tRNA synthetase class 1
MGKKEIKKKSYHWPDITADRIIREKGEKELYVCASGITPSGTVHIGNFREIISVDLVVRALRDKGKKARFIYSWDDYDVFRKVPSNMPKQKMLMKYLRHPITFTPDPYGKEKSYARHNEKLVEKILPVLGIYPEYIYQSHEYRKSVYAEEIKTALENIGKIKTILNKYRTEPLPNDWWPISIFCNKCMKDTTEIKEWDRSYILGYACSSCGHKERLDLRRSSCTKLSWRVDWPMRWMREKVDFEPAGKEHHTAGGSFDTAKEIVKEVYGYEPPVTFKYDFISIKGRGGKISSSEGEVLSIEDVLEIYQPEVLRYLFTSTRPNSEFAISFDLDVVKIYEDYDRSERIYFGLEKVSEKRQEKESRIYELSQTDKIPEKMTVQFGFRHLCNLLQIHEGDIKAVSKQILNGYEKVPEDHDVLASLDSDERLKHRAKCAWNWITKYAPESFRFRLRENDAEPVLIKNKEREVLNKVKEEVEAHLDEHDDSSLSEAIYHIASECKVEPKNLFKLMYRVLIGKEMGPRLANFMINIGKDRILKLLKPYLK